MKRTVPGFCPMGCGETLFLSDSGYITCNFICPRPSAVNEILGDPETEHIVDMKQDSYTLLHPLRERLDNALLDCTLHTKLAERVRPPLPVGHYRVTTISGWHHWAPLGEE